MSIQITLVCWHCRASRRAVVSREPQFGFELAGYANDIGMAGYYDRYRGRVLLFCNTDCAQREMTKAGNFRLRPKGPKPNEPQPAASVA